MVNIGIIGCGKIAQVRHFPEYNENEHAKIVGIFDMDIERVKSCAKQYGAKIYDTYEDLLSDSEIDAVSICVANNAHAEMTIKALKAGKHVLCEKPMAMSLKDCEKMLRTADECGRTLMIAHNQRLTAAHRKARELIADYILGDIITFRTTFGHGGPETWVINPTQGVWFFDKEKAVMGAMADLGIHKTDLIQYLLDQIVIETTAVVTTLNKVYSNGELIGVDDNAICIYKMNKGTLGTMTASWTHYGGEDNSTILYGTKGIMRIYDDPDHSIIITDSDGNNTYYDLEQIQTNDKQTGSGVIDSFVDCIENHKEAEISGESVIAAMRAVFASLESSRSGKTVKIYN